MYNLILSSIYVRVCLLKVLIDNLSLYKCLDGPQVLEEPEVCKEAQQQGR